MSIIGLQDRTVQFEPTPEELEEVERLGRAMQQAAQPTPDVDDNASEYVKAFDLGRKIGAECGYNCEDYFRGYREGFAERPTAPEPYRAARHHLTWELHPGSPFSRARRRRPGGAR